MFSITSDFHLEALYCATCWACVWGITIVESHGCDEQAHDEDMLLHEEKTQEIDSEASRQKTSLLKRINESKPPVCGVMYALLQPLSATVVVAELKNRPDAASPNAAQAPSQSFSYK